MGARFVLWLFVAFREVCGRECGILCEGMVLETV